MKYIIQKSETPGWWVVTDTENLVVLKLQEHRFNETQKVTMLEECNLSALQVARIMREMGDWVARHHIDKVFWNVFRDAQSVFILHALEHVLGRKGFENALQIGTYWIDSQPQIAAAQAAVEEIK